MTNIENVREPATGRRLIVPGVVFIVIAAIGVVSYIVLASAETPGSGSAQGALQGTLIVASAALGGLGVVLLLTGLLKSRRRTEGIDRPRAADEPRTLHER